MNKRTRSCIGCGRLHTSEEEARCIDCQEEFARDRLNPLEQALGEACLTALNLQGSAMRGAVPGLDVDWHFDKIRAALAMIGPDPVDVILRGEREDE